MNDKYSVSFTATSLETEEFRLCTAAFVRNNYAWDGLDAATAQANILGKTNPKTATRKLAEFKKRIEQLNDEQLNILATGSYEDAVNISFLSCIKTYPLLRDYCLEVLSPKITSFDTKATAYEFSQFIESKILSHPELAKVSSGTLTKVKQVIRRMLVQAGLLVLDEPQPNHPSPELLRSLLNENSQTIRAMLIKPAAVKAIDRTTS